MGVSVKTKNKLYAKENIAGWLFVSIPILSLLLFTLIPVIMSLYVSFTNWSGYSSIGNVKTVGFKNYADIFSGILSKDFYKSIANTLIMMLSVPIGLILALLLAAALNKKIIFRGGFRVIYYIPCVSNLVAVTILFNKMFNNYGVINSFLGVFSLGPYEWLHQPGLSRVIIIVMLIWKGLGYNMLLLLAGLQGISQEYYEAARLDGASGARMFLSITIPLIQPVIFFVVVTGIMGALQIYTEPAVLFPYTNGMGPEGGTLTPMVLLYYQYSNADNLGGASAIAWVLAVMIFIVTAVQFYVNSRRAKV